MNLIIKIIEHFQQKRVERMMAEFVNEEVDMAVKQLNEHHYYIYLHDFHRDECNDMVYAEIEKIGLVIKGKKYDLFLAGDNIPARTIEEIKKWQKGFKEEWLP